MLRRSWHVLDAGMTLAAIWAAGAIAYMLSQLFFPTCGGRSRLLDAIVGCGVVKQAAQVALALDPRPLPPCPSPADLVASHHLAPGHLVDPWGTPYAVHCDGDEVWVVSAGVDRIEGTDDDLRDHLAPAEIDRLEHLYAQRARGR